MTDERLAELAQFYRKWNEGRCNTGEIVTLLCSIPSLLAYVDFLRLLIHDLKEDSTAYQRGLEDGVRQGQASCAAYLDQEAAQRMAWNPGDALFLQSYAQVLRERADERPVPVASRQEGSEA